MLESVYEKVVLEVGNTNNVVNHFMFKNSFMEEYERLSQDGKYGVEISFNGGIITLNSSKNLPTATNGIYMGYKSIDSCSFSIENKHSNEYFCIRRRSSEVYSFDDKDKGDNVTYSETLNVFLNNEQVGKIEYLSSEESMKNIYPTFIVNKPDINLGFAINGDVPIINYTNGDVQCRAVGRTPGSGVARTSQYSCVNGKNAKSYGLCAVGLENPYSLDTYEPNFAEIKDGNFVCVNENYSSVDEAIASIQLKYDESIKSRSI